MSEKRLNDDLASMEAALGSLTPAPSSIDRDRLMFAAGRACTSRVSASRQPIAWLWPCATAASLLLAIITSTLWIAGDGVQVAERVVYVQSPAAVTTLRVADSRPSTAFAKWQPAPQLGSRYRDVKQPKTGVDRRLPGES